MAEREIRKLAAVMFTDIEGYTALVQMDEKVAMQTVTIHRRELEKYTREYEGQILQFFGDGSLSVYGSAVEAVRCAIAMQQAYQSGPTVTVPVRIGIHVGDIVFAEDTVFGDGVNIASRIQATGIPGSVLLSGRVQAELANQTEIKTQLIGRKLLKNVKDPVDIYAVVQDGLRVPSVFSRMPSPKSILRYSPLVLLAALAWWLIDGPARKWVFGEEFVKQSISIPVFNNLTGDPAYDHVGQMASHWITKELGSTPDANVVSYESASDMIQLAGISLATSHGRSRYASLTGAVNILEASMIRTGPAADTLLMSGYIKNLETGAIVRSLRDVRCSADNPMVCIQTMSGYVKGYWASKDDRVLTPPNYPSYKAFLAAKKAWRTADQDYVFNQLSLSIRLDSTFVDPYFLMLDYFYNEGLHQQAADTLRSMQRKFTDLDSRLTNLMRYHSADISGKNSEAYGYFLNEYKVDPKNMFTNNTAMVMALMYQHNPREALDFFQAIPLDSLKIEGCTYCAERMELAMWAALDLDSMSLAESLEPVIAGALYTRQSYGMLLMYHVRKKDTLKIESIIREALHDPGLENTWPYLYYLTGRLFALRAESKLTSVYARKAIEAYKPDNARMVGRSYYLDRQWESALSYYLQAHHHAPGDARILAELGLVYARLGYKDEMQQVIQKLDSISQPYDFGATEYFQGRLYAVTGDQDAALDLLERAVAKGQKYDLWVTFAHDPDLMSLWDHPRYTALTGE